MMSSNSSYLKETARGGAYFQCQLKLPQSWELGMRRMMSDDCITFHLGPFCVMCMHLTRQICPLDLPWRHNLHCLRRPGNPAAIVDAESSESGEIQSEGLHEGHAAFVVSTAPAPVSLSLPTGSVETPADIAPRNGPCGIVVPCFLNGGWIDTRRFFGFSRLSAAQAEIHFPRQLVPTHKCK